MDNNFLCTELTIELDKFADDLCYNNEASNLARFLNRLAKNIFEGCRLSQPNQYADNFREWLTDDFIEFAKFAIELKKKKAP